MQKYPRNHTISERGGGGELAKFCPKAQNWILTGRLGTHMADQEIGAISRSLLDNLGALAGVHVTAGSNKAQNAPIIVDHCDTKGNA